MFLRCRNSQTGHEASLPVGLVESGAMPDWTPLKGATPTAQADEPVYNTTPEPVPSGNTTSKEKAHVSDSE